MLYLTTEVTVQTYRLTVDADGIGHIQDFYRREDGEEEFRVVCRQKSTFSATLWLYRDDQPAELISQFEQRDVFEGTTEIPATQLKLGDVIEVLEGAFGTAIVKKLTDDSVHLYRPYGTCSNAEYSNEVICYVGIEEFIRPKTESEYFKVLERRTPRI